MRKNEMRPIAKFTFDLKYLFMKRIILISIAFLFIINFSFSQKTFLSDKKLWTDKQVYQMTEKFGIQDTFFTKDKQLKEDYFILYYIPQPEFDNYCQELIDLFKNNAEATSTMREIDNYMDELKNISTIDEWISLLNKYPRVKKIYEDSRKKSGFQSFSDFISKLKNNEYLVFLDNHGKYTSLVFSKNIPEALDSFKHLKRLK